MTSLAPWVLLATVHLAVFGVVARYAERWLTGRPQGLRRMWIAVLLGGTLFAPVTAIAWAGAEVITEQPTESPATEPMRPIAPSPLVRTSTSAASNAAASVGPASDPARLAAPAPVPTVVADAGPQLSPEMATRITWAWLALFALGLLRLGRRAWITFAVQSRLQRGDAAVHREASRLALAAGVTRPSIAVGHHIHTPMAVGPDSVWLPIRVAHGNPRARQAILAHEFGHLAARDPLWLWGLELLGLLSWWHPTTRHARRRIEWAAELSADRWAVEQGCAPIDLAQALADTAEAQRLQDTHRGATPPLLAASMAAGQLSLRVRHLFEPAPVQPTRRGVLTLAGATSVLVVALTPTPRVRAAPVAAQASARAGGSPITPQGPASTPRSDLPAMSSMSSRSSMSGVNAEDEVQSAFEWLLRTPAKQDRAWPPHPRTESPESEGPVRRTSAKSKPPSRRSPRVTLEADDALLSAVLEKLAKRTGLSYVLAPGIGHMRVSLRVRSAGREDVLEALQRSHGLEMTWIGSVLHIEAISPDLPDGRAAPTSHPPSAAENVAQPLPSAPTATAILHPKHHPAQRVRDLLTPVLGPDHSITVDTQSNSLVIVDTPDNIERARALASAMDVDPPRADIRLDVRVIQASTGRVLSKPVIRTRSYQAARIDTKLSAKHGRRGNDRLLMFLGAELGAYGTCNVNFRANTRRSRGRHPFRHQIRGDHRAIPHGRWTEILETTQVRVEVKCQPVSAHAPLAPGALDYR